MDKCISLRDLCASYSRFSLAEEKHNEEILSFLERVAMTTKRGALSAIRAPDFFSLGRAQGRKSFTILMRNDDGSLGGIAALSVSSMQIKGEQKALVYASDLRLSDGLSRRTRLQFHQWYEELALRCAEIEEFEGSPYLITSIFDENSAAVRALVDKKKNRREPLYRPLFSYQNINVIGRWRNPGRGRFRAEGARESREIKEFLVSNPEGAQIVWSEGEVERRLAALGLGYEDFLLVRREGRLCGVCLPYSDSAFRRTVLKNLSRGVRWVGRSLPLLGKPAFREGTPLKNGFLGFLKVDADSAEEKADIIAALLSEFLRRQRLLPRRDRCHTITVMDAQDSKLDLRLKQRGFLFTRLPATLYQVVHRKNFQRKGLLRATKQRRPDFEVGLA